MTLGLGAVLVFLATGAAQSPAAPAPAPPACFQGVATSSDAAAVELCLGEEQVRRAEGLPKQDARRSRQLEGAAERYRRAASLASRADTRTKALEALEQLYGAERLNEPHQVEAVLRELIALQPNQLAPIFRLAKVQEDDGRADAAEDTLFAVHRQQPDAVEPYQMLAQFYARRVTALSKQVDGQKPPQAPDDSAERDENGVYRVGGAVSAPSRLDVAKYPSEAAAAGIQGAVLVEIVIDESGTVADAKVVRSIPLLDESALQAVRNWRFAPTVLNGQPVPVKMVVTVNFTTR
jgi:TonB family protein